MFDNVRYQRLLTALEESIFPHITETRTDPGGVAGRAREPVLFQIDHGTAHLKRVRKNMEILLAAADAAPERRLRLEDPQRFIALAAATFHDLGMHFGWYAVHPDIHEPITLDQAAIVRKDHGRISAEWFRLVQLGMLPPELKLSPDLAEILSDPWLLSGLVFVIEAHQWGLSTLEEQLRDKFPDEEDRCWMRGLACLVKLADTLDMDSRRVSRPVVERAVNALLGRPSDIRAIWTMSAAC